MKLIESSVEVLEQEPGLDGIYKQIEKAGRTCYRSEDKITEDSAKGFVDRMIKLGHGAMLEHGTVYLEIPIKELTKERKYLTDITPRFTKYCVNVWKEDLVSITTNLRVIVENGWEKYLKYVQNRGYEHEPRITVKFICDRGVSHEFVRHRVFSFAQESTRYCNYSKSKFNNELTFIKPTWDDGNDENPQRIIFLKSLAEAEQNYLQLLELGQQPQQARAVLPNALKTELVMTGFASDWVHFFELRCAKNAHPDARKLAIEALSKLYKLYPNYFEELYDKYCRQEG